MADKLDSAQHKKILEADIIPSVLGGVKPAKGKPRFCLLGGQPGAGKSKVTEGLKGGFQGAENVTVIDPDELRIYHPDYAKFVQEDPNTAASRVQTDASRWANELRAEAVKRRLNVIYDGTLSVTGKATDMAISAAKEGYGVEVHVVATPLEASKQGVRSRYETAFEAYQQDPAHSAPPRNVPDDIQTGAYANIPASVQALCKSGVVSRVRVTNRNNDNLSDLVGRSAVKQDGGASATKALQAERTRPWTQAEIDEFKTRGDRTRDQMTVRMNHAAKPAERAAIQGEITDFQDTQGKVVRKKDGELKEDCKKKDAWLAEILNFKVSEYDIIVSDGEELDDEAFMQRMQVEAGWGAVNPVKDVAPASSQSRMEGDLASGRPLELNMLPESVQFEQVTSMKGDKPDGTPSTKSN